MFACHCDFVSNKELLRQLSIMIKSWKIDFLIYRLVKACGHWPRTKDIGFHRNIKS